MILVESGLISFFGWFWYQEYQVLHEKYMTLKKAYSEQEMVSLLQLLLLFW